MFAAAVAVAGKVFVFGGRGPRDDDEHGESRTSTERFDPTAGTWHQFPRMTWEEESPSIGIIAGEMYVVGSHGAQHLDPVAEVWRQLPPMVQVSSGKAFVAC